MALLPQKVIVAKAALLPLGLALAMAAFVHAGSETEVFSMGAGVSSRLGLDGHIAAEIVDSGFRAEMARLRPEVQGELPRLSASLIALARDSFAADPLAVSSLRTIALGSVLTDDEGRARRLMRLAAQMSKRDSITDLWLAQDYGRANDFEAMIASFDHALRTSTRVRDFAIKPMVETLASEESYAPLGELLARRPEWEDAFWQEFSRNPVALANAANFFETSSTSLEQLPVRHRRVLYASLKQTRQFDALYRIAAISSGPRASLKALATGKFVMNDNDNPLGWTLRSQGNFAARVHEKTGEMQIDARAGAFGIAADRVVRGNGTYRLTFAMVAPVPDNAELKLVVRCAEDSKRELVSLPGRAGDRAGEVTFSVDDCEFANLELRFEVDAGRRDALIRVASITLEQT